MTIQPKPGGLCPHTRFGLIRHAQTRWNHEKRIQGQSDSPLTGYGRCQADRWADLLKSFSWDRILTSDLGRAVETAGRIQCKLGLPVSRDPRLREQDWGRWTGKQLEEIRSQAEQMVRTANDSGWGFRPPGGEDRLSVLRRSRRALVDAARRWPGRTLLTIAHGGVVASLLQDLSGRKWIASEPRLLRTHHLHWLGCDGTELLLEEINALDLSDGAAHSEAETA
jgi:broad specificity phosphatase PhoE